jgi:hypothetical protein
MLKTRLTHPSFCLPGFYSGEDERAPEVGVTSALLIIDEKTALKTTHSRPIHGLLTPVHRPLRIEARRRIGPRRRSRETGNSDGHDNLRGFGQV